MNHPKIIEKYNFNVAEVKTKFKSELDAGQKGGACQRECNKCIAFGDHCKGCDFQCPDRYCLGNDCHRCPFLCYRGGDRLEKALSFVDGLKIDCNKTKDHSFICSDNKFIPAYNKKLPNSFSYPIVSIPFYAIYDFYTQSALCIDVKDYFNVPDETNVIVNFYMKDDKIMVLFDLIIEGIFLKTIKHYNGVDFWHTPCFSVFKISSGMDCLLNFKRQFWIGDIMRDSGLNVFQEVLYSTLKKKAMVSPAHAMDILVKKGIKKIAQCGQLNFDENGTLQREMSFIRSLPKDISWLITGLSQKMMDAYNNLRKNMFFSNYSAQFRFKDSFESYIKTVNSSLKRR